MHIYAFGSLCRGEVSRNSDVDLLALVDGFDERFNPEIYSIYSYRRIEELWREGNPFAWHLSLESRLVACRGDNISGVTYV
jgi:predicted nucleotidyltransferase